MAEDADNEPDQHQGDVGAGAVGQQRGEGQGEVGHYRVIIIGPCPKGLSQR